MGSATCYAPKCDRPREKDGEGRGAPKRVIGGVIRGFRRGHQDLEMSLVEFWIFLDPLFRINLEMTGW